MDHLERTPKGIEFSRMAEAERTASAPPPSADAIFRLDTAPGEAAIAAFVLDGAELFERFTPLFRSKQALSPAREGQLAYGSLVDAAGVTVDEVVCAVVTKDRSETARAQIEVSCHGGRGTAAAVRELFEAAGIREARPGELLARAHRAGRLSLLALEARLRLGACVTARQLDLLLAHTNLQERWERLGMEAALGIRLREIAWHAPTHTAAADELARYEAARRLLRTHRVLVAGPVNAGKSTLVNRLLRENASLVSAEAGTTRDRLERPATLRGLSLLLIDGAGLRDEAGDAVERAGQAKALEAAAEADLDLLVVDGSRAPSPAECEALAALTARPFLLVLNKADLGLHEEAEGLAFAFAATPYRIAARDGTALDALEAAMESALGGGAPAEPGGPFTPRQERALQALKIGLEQGVDGVDLLGHIRTLVGTRPNESELDTVFREAEEAGAHAHPAQS